MNNSRVSKRSPLWSGLPFILSILSGYVLIGYFLGPKYEMLDKKTVSTRNFNLEEEHKALMGKLNIQDYSLSRIPRPDEQEKK